MLNLKRMLTKLATTISNKTTIVREQRPAAETTFTANTNGNFRVNIVKSGYVPLGIIGLDLKNGSLTPISYNIAGSTEVTVWAKNQSSSSITVTPTVTILYQKQ